PVSGEAVLLLPRLDLGYRTGADLPVHSRADDLLDGGVIEGAFMLHLVPAGDVPEVPALADALPLIPGPAIQEPIPLDPGLNLAGVDIDREAVLVVRAEVGGGDGDTAGLACPDRSRVGAVRRVLPTPADLGVVRLEKRYLVRVRAQCRPDGEVDASVRDGPVQHPGEGLVRVPAQP